jgi:TfoX/Sxy family transcriptional regulator of competence genes
MPWVKIPAEHKPIFYAVVPQDDRVSTIEMFGGVAMMVGGHMAGGLFGESAFVRLDPPSFAKATKQGAVPFDPMDAGRPMNDTLLLPKGVMKKKAELAKWLQLALDFTATLPPKKKKAAKKKTAARKR